MAGGLTRIWSGLGIDAAKQKALLQLRARLTIRQFTNEPGKLVGLLISALFFVPAVLALAVASVWGYRELPGHWPSGLMGIVLTILWGIWLVMPLAAYSINQSLDLTRLLVYPLSSRELTVAVLLGAIFDFPTYLLLPFLGAILFHWYTPAMLPILLVGLALCFGHMIMINQLVLVAAGGILRSRRFRDVMLITVSLLGFFCYFVSRAVEVLLRPFFENPAQMAALQPLTVLQWLPPGAVARAIERAAAEQWMASLLWLLYAAGWLLLVVWAWRRLFQQVVTGGGFLRFQGRKARPASAGDARPSSARWGLSGAIVRAAQRRIPYDVRMLWWNELRRSWRIPQRRIGLLQGLLSPFLFGGFFFFNTRGGAVLPEWAGLGLPIYTVFSIWLISINMLGWEGTALSMLLTTPVPRQRIFQGKSLGLLCIVGLPVTVLGIGMITIARSWWSVVGLIAALGAAASVLGILSIISVLFPYPVNLESVQRQSSFSSGGCITALANLAFVPACLALICLPIAIPLAVALWQQLNWIAIASIPLILAYGGLVFWLGTRFAGRLLVRREAEVLQATRLPDGG